MTNFQISLPESMKAFIEEEVAKGGYGSASEYLQELILQDQQQKGQERKRAHLMAKLHTQGQLDDEEFEVLADKLADEFAANVGSNLPVLSDYAISRESVYEDHP
ncbi:MAG: type II toxin-antitoxin system ParD family antitoxin [Desmonostoc geniculatum HA4340-LM1]|jgi:antitoxin ParD1/3/4|nr:type II toxin-antitoxin system ParD family antitoxin [Desmonostoc geniculatum HA4340-LM1]